MVIAVTVIESLLYRAIRRQATRDESRPADAMVVFGAAQYNGMPSPVFKARLDHAFDLEEQGLVPLVITTGGSGGDPHYTESGVGKDYLVQKGMDAAKILLEDRSETTFGGVAAVSQLLHRRHARTCLVVSDGFHLYRVERMFSAQGIVAYASPVPDSPIEADAFDRTLYTLREMLLSTLWHLGYRG